MPSVKIPTTEEKWQRVLSDRGDCPTEDGRHAWVWLAAKSSAFHFIAPDKAADLIRSALTRPELRQGNETEVDPRRPQGTRNQAES